MIDKKLLDYLKIKLDIEDNKKPTRQDIERILQVKTRQAYHYLKAIREAQK
jgi:Mn-dependent DtxR family transcriptional regulator